MVCLRIFHVDDYIWYILRIPFSHQSFKCLLLHLFYLNVNKFTHILFFFNLYIFVIFVQQQFVFGLRMHVICNYYYIYIYNIAYNEKTYIDGYIYSILLSIINSILILLCTTSTYEMVTILLKKTIHEILRSS